MQKFHSTLNKRIKVQKVQYVAPMDCAASLDEWLTLTRAPDAKVRQQAVGNACPCHLKRNVPEL